MKRLVWGLSGLTLSLALLGIPAIARTIVSSIGDTGVQAGILHAPPYNLTGRKIAIGQVEIGRPALFGL
ncbi:MAG: peptidase S8 and S53 subtilisin kexin sedolisin, partial [Oculatellaceae cyanobacterium Prado106]|nr:peptidase S8 and S53 subtilisin kexin sedolisin [Oculatellaceae cyanobacterium Prado106]